MSIPLTINTHETIAYYAGVMRYILEPYQKLENQDDSSSRTSIGRFCIMKKHMPLEMRRRIFDIYSHFDYMKRLESTETMPVVSFGNSSKLIGTTQVVSKKGWRRPDPRFLDSCYLVNPKWREANAMGIKPKGTENERPFVYNLHLMYYSIDDQLFSNSGDSVSNERFFDVRLDPVIPFHELTSDECLELRRSPARNTIETTWQEYIARTGLPLANFTRDESRLKFNGIGTYPVPSRSYGSFEEIFDIVTKTPVGKALGGTNMSAYEQLERRLANPVENTDYLRKKGTPGLKPGETRVFQIPDYQEALKRFIEQDVYDEHERVRLVALSIKKENAKRRLLRKKTVDVGSDDDDYVQ